MIGMEDSRTSDTLELRGARRFLSRAWVGMHRYAIAVLHSHLPQDLLSVHAAARLGYFIKPSCMHAPKHSYNMDWPTSETHTCTQTHTHTHTHMIHHASQSLCVLAFCLSHCALLCSFLSNVSTHNFIPHLFFTCTLILTRHNSESLCQFLSRAWVGMHRYAITALHSHLPQDLLSVHAVARLGYFMKPSCAHAPKHSCNMNWPDKRLTDLPLAKYMKKQNKKW